VNVSRKPVLKSVLVSTCADFMALLPALGSLIADKYRIEALIGEGGMGAVFRARHELMDKAVALKWLRPGLASHAESRDRFIREARAMARVRHPNVIEVYDVGVHQGALFLVMELLEGESFESVLERGTMPIPRALRLLIESMQGVAEAHRRKIIHRDIKPENIFIVYDAQHPDGVAKVLDFGVSKLIDDAPHLLKITHTGATMGTPLYMSFEQMNGVSDLDARADVYSFGVLLYRALAGRLPFEADTFAALALAIVTKRPAAPKQLRSELPTSIDSVVMKALAIDRNERHSSLDELIDALTLLASTEGFLGQMTQPSAMPPLLTPRTSAAFAPSRGRGQLDPASSTPPVSLPVPELRTTVLGSSNPVRRLGVWLVAIVLVCLGLRSWLWSSPSPREHPSHGPSTSGTAREERTAFEPPSTAEPPRPAPDPVPALPADRKADAISLSPLPVQVAPPAAPALTVKDKRPARVVVKAKRAREGATPLPAVARLAEAEAETVPSAEPPAAVTPTATPRAATGQRSGTLRRDRL
jgi:serine/threonine-protein kinase